MTCDDVSRSEIVEQYLLGQLSENARDAFEAHYFECARCFGLLQAYRDVRSELARTRDEAPSPEPKRSWIWQWSLAPAMAVVLIAVSVAVWQRPGNDTVLSPEERPSSTPSAQPAPKPPPPSSRATIAELARVEPPRYVPPRLRGAVDEAAARFQDAMEHYQRGNYPAAIAGLREAARLDPEAPHTLFFLGASHLMAAQPDPAIDALGKTIALGDTPYLEEAHFLRAKAFLRKGDVDSAVADLGRVIRLEGVWAREARQLMTEFEAMRKPLQ